MVVTLFKNPLTPNFAAVGPQIDKYVPKPRLVKSSVPCRVNGEMCRQYYTLETRDVKNNHKIITKILIEMMKRIIHLYVHYLYEYSLLI